MNFSKSIATDKEHRYLLGAAPSTWLPVGCCCGEFVPRDGDLGCRLPQEAQTPLSAQALLGEIAQARGAPGFLLCPRVEWRLLGCFVDEALEEFGVWDAPNMSKCLEGPQQHPESSQLPHYGPCGSWLVGDVSWSGTQKDLSCKSSVQPELKLV